MRHVPGIVSHKGNGQNAAMSFFSGPGRGRAWLRCMLAIAVFVVVQSLAAQAADGFRFQGLSASTGLLLRNLFQLFLEVLSFAVMGLLFDRQTQPLRAMGLARSMAPQTSALRQFALGAALGWGMVVALLLPVALSGGLYVHLWITPRAFALLTVQLLTLFVAALSNEVVFRGYPFQRLMEATGPGIAVLLSCVLFGWLRWQAITAMPGSDAAAIWVSVAAAILLSLAYLRTRALWLSWGLHFAWLASMGVLFGLPLAGETDTASVIQSNAYGQHWLTGGDYGPESAWLTVGVLVGGIWVLLRMTRQMDWHARQPVLRPAGIAVEIAHAAPASVAAAPAKPTAAPPSLVQIAAYTSAPPSSAPKEELPS